MCLSALFKQQKQKYQDGRPSPERKCSILKQKQIEMTEKKQRKFQLDKMYEKVEYITVYKSK